MVSLSEVMDGLPEDFAFFADRFVTRVQPALAAREADRKGAVASQRNFTIGGVLAGVAIFFACGAFIEGDGYVLGAFVGVMAVIGAFAWGSMAINRLEKELKLMLVEPVTAEFGMNYQLQPAEPRGIHLFRSLGLVPSWDRSKYEDRITGSRHDMPFEFFEAHLEEKRTTSDGKGRTQTTWVTVFRGQCLIVKFHKPFSGVTKVFRDQGVFNIFGKLAQMGKTEKVRLEDPVFEKAFEVYATDQVEARFILTPDFMERLVGLERAFGGRQVRCAFSGGEMLLACEGKNLLEIGSMYRPMDDLGRVREMLVDFAAIFLLIDAMSRRLTPDALRGP